MDQVDGCEETRMLNTLRISLFSGAVALGVISVAVAGFDGKKVGDTWLRRDEDDGRMYMGRVVAGLN
jgi:hypothetical protein